MAARNGLTQLDYDASGAVMGNLQAYYLIYGLTDFYILPYTYYFSYYKHILMSFWKISVCSFRLLLFYLIDCIFM